MRVGLAAGVAAILVASVNGVGAEPAAAARPRVPAVRTDRSVPVSPVTSHYRKPAAMPVFHAKPVTWPVGQADARLDRAPAGKRGVRAGTLPVWLGTARRPSPTPATIHVDLASQAAATAAGVQGMLMSARPSASGGARIRVSYAPLRDAFGGDWSSRLRLVTLPACALTTPGDKACRAQTPLASTNDSTAQTVEADVPFSATAVDSGVAVAAVSDSGGGGGDFSATSLRPSGSWQAGGPGDTFSWTYPISVPSVPGDLLPKVQLSYDSQSQDGLTSSTNNQASWIGDGWDYSAGYIERSYASCHENPAGTTRSWDTCWSDKNTLTLSLNGSSTSLVQDDTTGEFHTSNDGTDKVEHLTGADNGAQNGEYWRITTTDGTQYYFGKQKLPGWSSSSDALTNSVWTEPVFATSSQQPCYNATFANSWCTQAYRWNLDYVVDTHKDTIAYFYDTESNSYARNLGSTATSTYIRSGSLNRIQYGQRDGQVFSTSPAAEVLFTTNGRCDTPTTGCATSTLDTSTAAHWPDVPYDQNCKPGAACSVQAPTFWTTTTLAGIQTKVLVNGAETPVDAWKLNHSFPTTGDSTSPSLWLESIIHTGQDTTAGGSSAAITLPAVTFTGRPLPNRVKVAGPYPPITRHRMDTITTETGEIISVDYSSALTTAPADPSQNSTLAYPAYWTPDGQSAPTLDWFNKYVVTHVTEQDPTGGPANDNVVTTYTPVGTPAWHYDTDPLTPSARRTWNQWRGYEGMAVSSGNAPDPVTKAVYTYFRGMDGDHLPSGSRSATVTDSRHDAAVTDLDQFNGLTYETLTYNGDAVVSDSISDPWTSKATATQAATGIRAYRVGEARERDFVPLADGTTRQTEIDKTHDANDPYNRVTAVSDLGDVATDSDDSCTVTTFADNTSKWILNATAETKTYSVACGKTPSIPGDVVSDTQNLYDNTTTVGAAPTTGDVTGMKTLKSYTGTTANWVSTTKAVDQYGRTTSVTNPLSHTTTTAYTPATGAAPVSVTDTDALKMSTTTTYDALRGVPTSTTDPAGFVTTQQYDALGRVTAVFEPGRAAPNSPNIKYTYAVSNSGPSVVTSYALNHDATGYRQSETLYDSMLRERETQTQAPGSGRIVTDVFYNTDGWKSAETDPYYNADPLSSTIEPANAGKVDSTTGYLYDGAGRQTAAIAYQLGTETWRTTYIYGGDFVTTVPPSGATATTTVEDARGRAILQRQYHASVAPDYLHATAGTYDDTTYGYTPDDKLASQRDSAGNSWSWSYDLLGDQIDATDPDAGHSASTYDDSGKVITHTDAEKRQTTTTYDGDGRRTAVYDTSATKTLSAANKLSAWTYDTVKKGMPATVTSYSGGDTYTDSVLAYNNWAQVATRRITLTGTDAALVPAAGLTFSYGFNLNGTPSGRSDPASGSLPAENISYGYDSLDQQTGLAGTGAVSSAYVMAVGYDHFGDPLRYTLGAGATNGFADLSYDAQTRTLTGTAIFGFGHTGDIDDTTYTFGGGSLSKGSGLLTKTVDKEDDGTKTDTQCYGYDYATRLQQAWTATDGCATTPTTGSSSTVGGQIAPYWQSWTYDTAGDRQTQTDHDVTGTSGGDTTLAYHYPAAGQRHTLTSTTVSGPAQNEAATYAYDASGNTATITGGVHGNQALTWTTLGKVATDTTSAGTTGYAYNADGTQIIARDPTTTTLVVQDEEIVLNRASNTLSGTRYYSINGTTIATRSSAGTVTYLMPDRQGTSQVAVDAATGTVARREFLPFGEARGTAPSTWPGAKSYVGGTTDTNTGLETIGAREYDSDTGRFLSRDPVLEADNEAEINGYSYAGNDPVTLSDPTGLWPVNPDIDDQFGHAKPGTGADYKNRGPGGNSASPGSSFQSEKRRITTEELSEYNVRHRASRDRSLEFFETLHPDWIFTPEYHIPGGSKKMNGNSGYADIIGYDPKTDWYYIWEVKHVGGSITDPAGAEAQGPKDIAKYIAALKRYKKTENVSPGEDLPGEITQQDPIDRRLTLVTNSSLKRGITDPKFAGVLVYWTRNKRDSDEKSNRSFKDQFEDAAKQLAAQQNPASAPAAKPSGWHKFWHDLVNPPAVPPPNPFDPDLPDIPGVPDLPDLPIPELPVG
jgi:RHS repeat-associated protein